MLDDAQARRELREYRNKLIELALRYGAGERSALVAEAQVCEDALTCLHEEVPEKRRERVAYLIDRFEALRQNCSS